MKIPRSAQGFTLIELLTVIAIIAVLMGLLFSAMGGVKDSGNKTKAKNDLVQIVTAVKAYYTEYGKYPIATQGTDTSLVASGDNSTLIKVLVAKETTTPALNPRAIVYLEPPAVKDASAPKGGVDPNYKFYDPWGKTYGIAFDSDYDNQVANPYSSNAGPAKLDTGVIAWSTGKNGPKGGSGDKKSTDSEDDIISWQ